MAAKHWSETQEKTNTAGISLLLTVFRLGGRTLFHLSLWPVIVFYWLVSPTARCASRLYLDHVARTKKEPRPGCLATLKHIWRFADTILDKLLAVSGFFTAKDLAVEGVPELLADPRGAIIITAHTGCQELCQFIGETELEKSEATKNRLVYVLTHTAHAARFTEVVSKLNPKFAVRHLQVTDVGPQTAVQMSEIIEAGHWIVIVADRTPIGSSACVRVPFLGEEAPLALGPFLLATLLKCSAWSMICARETEPQSAARYRVSFTRIYDGVPVARAKRSQTLSAMANAWVRTLESRLLKSPYDWFNFFDFWHPAQSRLAQKSRRPQAQQNQSTANDAGLSE